MPKAAHAIICYLHKYPNAVSFLQLNNVIMNYLSQSILNVSIYNGILRESRS